jgi:hypothetical protein
VLAVPAVTFANGGDSIGVYVPVFAAAGTGGLVVFAAVFLALVAVWCAASRFFATRPLIARALARWGHIVLPAVLIKSTTSSTMTASSSSASANHHRQFPNLSPASCSPGSANETT